MRKENRSRALRNFSILLVMATIIWAVRGFDLPTMEMKMHRAERQHMMDESRIIWKYDGKMYNDRDMIVGLGSKYITTCAESGHLSFWPRNADTPTLVMLPIDTRYTPPGTGHSYLAPSFLAVDAPARAQSARLHILLEYNDRAEVYTAEGQKQDSIWFFQLEKHYYPNSENATDEELYQNRWEYDAMNMFFARHPDGFYYPCTVEFFDKDGAPISTLELNGGVNLT